MNKLIMLFISGLILSAIGMAMFKKKYSVMWFGGLLLIAILNFS